MSIFKFLVFAPYTVAAICLLSSCFLVLRQNHLKVPVSALWWPLRWGYGVLVVDKSLLTKQGIELHSSVVRRIWWFIRFSILGLLLGVGYVLVFQV